MTRLGMAIASSEPRRTSHYSGTPEHNCSRLCPITFRGLRTGPITLFPDTAFFVQSLLVPGSTCTRPVGSEAAAGGRSRRPFCYKMAAAQERDGPAFRGMPSRRPSTPLRVTRNWNPSRLSFQNPSGLPLNRRFGFREPAFHCARSSSEEG